jgi:hypothetical protein
MNSHFELLPKESLPIAAFGTQRPVAFLVGAPLSQQDGLGVPAVAGVLDLVREEVKARAAFALGQFDAALVGKSGGPAYQAAMKWLANMFGQDALNEVIRKAVLKARKVAAPPLADGGDGNPDDWDIPGGCASLGRLVAAGGKFVGPVLTTNFDPLISLSIHKAGRKSVRRVLVADGAFAGAAEEDADVCQVVHLHGFWRGSETLHTPGQLTQARPKLAKSLQRLLQKRTLIVVAYSGWDDAFTAALADLINDEEAALDVVWCFYEDDAALVQERYKDLLKSVERAISMHRFRAFGGIDCHGVFDELVKLQGTALLGDPAPAPARAAAAAPAISPIAGWETLDAAYLATLPPLGREEVIRYFDGATPSWRHALAGEIPTRAAVPTIVGRLEDAMDSKAACSLQLIRAAGGEGKSTILLQAAVAALRRKGVNVLWRSEWQAALPSDQVLKLDPSRDWILVADDAESLVGDIFEAARCLHRAGRTNVHFLVAARDTDWRFAVGDQQPWGTLLHRHPEVFLRGLTENDAPLLVEAWRAFGAEGLRALETLPDADAQVAALVTAAKDELRKNGEDSFFGGLLAVRFGAEGLRSHIVTLLARLKERRIGTGERTLFEALVYVAACHAVGISGIDENVLADLLGVDRNWIQTHVAKPLGEEAAAVRSAGHVLTRHHNVASAIIAAAEGDFGVDLGEVWSAIVRQTVRTAQAVTVESNWFSKVVHIGPSLQKSLPDRLSQRRRREIAVSTARAVADARPDRVSSLVDLGKTYRDCRDFPAAIALFRQNLAHLPEKVDFHTDARGYWYEWGIAEGTAGNHLSSRLAGAWLQGLSIADPMPLVPITMKKAMLSFAGLGMAFGKLIEPRPDCPFARGRRAAGYLGMLTSPDNRTRGFFEEYDEASDRAGVPQPPDIAGAVAWLTAAVREAGRRLEDPFLVALLDPQRVSFNMLLEKLCPAQVRRGAGGEERATSRLLAGIAAKVTEAKDDLEEKVRQGVERVLKQAWESVPAETPPAARLPLAREKAADAIRRVSASIRNRVSAQVKANDWEPLRTRDPFR